MAERIRPFLAELRRTERGSTRCVVRFSTSVFQSPNKNQARIHDLSETGLRLETPDRFDLDEIVIVELPYVGQISTRIVWSDAGFYGGKFLEPIPKAGVSAALLRSQRSPPIQAHRSKIEEIDIGRDPSIEHLTAWALELERNRGATGNQLVGFVRSPEGVIKALVRRTD
ncbi:PilZ domain-containing protein [Erythrobacter sp.]|jgi:hypothetical protein|uniref:PilZ domain-containing protein n=1 Tax=Erythrobacter sp. TaxID=1042 RepID=UPI002EB8A134|nr:PilZ domain-containing protein [Erythrobacter sp.]